MPNIYKEMILAWADIDITHNTDNYQKIIYEPIHDNPKLGNTHYTQLTKENMHLVRDIWNVGTDDFIDWVGCSTSRLFYCQIQQLHACFPQDWLKTLKTTDYFDGDSDTIFFSSEVERSLMVRWVVGSILHGVDPLSYFSFQPVLHDWCNKGRGMCHPVYGMVHIK